MVEKSDKFDERMFNRQNFPHQNLQLENFSIAYFTVIIYQLQFVTLCRDMESRVLSFVNPCRKDAPEDKDLPEENGPCISKVIASYHGHHDQLQTVTLMYPVCKLNVLLLKIVI